MASPPSSTIMTSSSSSSSAPSSVNTTLTAKLLVFAPPIAAAIIASAAGVAIILPSLSSPSSLLVVLRFLEASSTAVVVVVVAVPTLVAGLPNEGGAPHTKDLVEGDDWIPIPKDDSPPNIFVVVVFLASANPANLGVVVVATAAFCGVVDSSSITTSATGSLSSPSSLSFISTSLLLLLSTAILAWSPAGAPTRSINDSAASLRGELSSMGVSSLLLSPPMLFCRFFCCY
mmetsp:Transcript_19287/g.32554  ORF Transcript_19287/g.32554 Transcript_19287/m.32554 type:complete len:231 (+) Transcript_19287:6176-6868(+)